MDDWPPRSSGELGGPRAPRGQQPPPRRGYSGQQGQPRRPRPPDEYDRRGDYDRQRPRPQQRPQPYQGRSRPPTRPRPPARRTGGRRSGWFTARTVLAVVSALVLASTAYGWSAIDRLTAGLSTTDVIDPAAQGNSGPQNILLAGLDTRTDARGNPLPRAELNALHAGSAADGADGTDTLILLHIPAGGGQAVGFSIPRDSYVQLTGGFGMHKINSAYTYADVAETKTLRDKGTTGPQLVLGAAQAGARNTIQTVEQLTGVTINHYAAVNLVGFYDISNAIKGVQICVKKATSDPNSGANFKAGVQTVQGAKALAYVRQRHGLPDSDLDRVKRQQAFLASMAHKVLSAGTLTSPSKLSALVDALQKSITLSKGWDVLNFAQQLQGLSAGAIKFYTIPIGDPNLHTSDGSSVEVDPAQVQSFIHQQISASDTPPPTPGKKQAAAPKPTTPPTRNNASIKTEVYNATGIPGLAAGVLGALTSKGYTSGGTGNSSARTSTVVDYAAGDQAAAQQVATSLGGSIATVSSTLVSPGTVRVYLGTSYSGPKDSSGTSTSTPTTASKPPPAITGTTSNCLY